MTSRKVNTNFSFFRIVKVPAWHPCKSNRRGAAGCGPRQSLIALTNA